MGIILIGISPIAISTARAPKMGRVLIKLFSTDISLCHHLKTYQHLLFKPNDAPPPTTTLGLPPNVPCYPGFVLLGGGGVWLSLGVEGGCGE